MRITREDAEAWYRGDEDQNVSAHQVATFYRGETVALEAKLAEAVKALEFTVENGACDISCESGSCLHPDIITKCRATLSRLKSPSPKPAPELHEVRPCDGQEKI